MEKAGISTGNPPARLPDAAFDLLDALRKMRVARIQFVPRVQDANHRLAGIVLGAVAHLFESRPMAEGTKVVGAEPPETAKLFRGFGHWFSFTPPNECGRVFSPHREAPIPAV